LEWGGSQNRAAAIKENKYFTLAPHWPGETMLIGEDEIFQKEQREALEGLGWSLVSYAPKSHL
jgi:hypothetical protein